jgi:addiction module HigA family antidote
MKNGMRPIHPGEILREEYLKPLGITSHALSKLLHVPPARVNEIVRETRGITPDTALRLARFFGGDAQSWMNLQVAYDLKLAEKAVAKMIEKEVPTLDELKANDERFALAA